MLSQTASASQIPDADYAREEKRLKSEYAQALITEAKDEIKRYKIFGFEELANKL